MAFETDSAGAIGLRYTWGLETDDLIGVCPAPCTTEANHYYVTVDQSRNVREVTRRDGTWLLSRRFGPYGAQIEEAGAVSFELRYRWTGREYDAETGFYFHRSRYYSLVARRFVQEDPVGYAGGASLYQYGGGNSLNGRDPDGLVMNADAYIPVKETLDPGWGMSGVGSSLWDDLNPGGFYPQGYAEFVAYNTYVRNYEDARRQISATLMAASHQHPRNSDLAKYYFDLALRVRQSGPLSEDQFTAATQAIGRLPATPGNIMGALTNAGRLFVQEALVPLYAGARVFFGENGAGEVFVAVSHRLFAYGGEQLTHGLAHEAAHYYNWMTGRPHFDTPGGGGPVEQRACAWYYYARSCS